MTERKGSEALPQMSADYNAAMDKLRDEMALSKDQALGAIGEIMTALLQAAPEWAGAILTKGKTLLGAYGALEEYARKNRGGKNCVYVPPETAQEVICGYYGIRMEGDVLKTEPDVFKTEPDVLKTEPDVLKAEHKAPEPDPFDLDALLEGI